LPSSGEKQFSGGKGSEDDPYRISSASDLLEIASKVNAPETYERYSAAHYVQTGDIDLSGHEWIPIGKFPVIPIDIMSFRGRYDGGGFKILNMKISSTGDKDLISAGLFGFVEANGNEPSVIENVYLSDSDIYFINEEQDAAVGAIVGRAGTYINEDGIIVRNCTASGITMNTFSYAMGGMIGANSGTAENCNISCEIVFSPTDTDMEIAMYSGGFAGINSGIIKECTADIKMKSNAVATEDISSYDKVGDLGGFVGDNGVWELWREPDRPVDESILDYSDRTLIEDCEVSGIVEANLNEEGEYYRIGTFANGNNGRIINCKAELKSNWPEIKIDKATDFVIYNEGEIKECGI
jgi:hypothetical protein